MMKKKIIKLLIINLIVPVENFLRRMSDQVSRNYLYDERIFRKWARPISTGVSWDAIQCQGEGYTHVTLRALLTMEYHRIEKALALPSPRYGFGQDVVARLVDLLQIYRRAFGDDSVTKSAGSALASYLDFHHGVAEEDAPEILVKVKECINALPEKPEACGTILKTRCDILSYSNINYSEFCSSRHSIRDFEQSEVNEGIIFESVTDAGTTPTVCNRQANRVVYLKDPIMIAKALELQNGNRGFGAHVHGLFIVYYEISNFVSVGERNQGWIDSGMYSMNLVLALHARGIGSCCLNWSVEQQRDKQMVDLLNLDESSRIVMLIAVGNLKNTFRVAASSRFPVSEVLKVL